MVLVFADTDGYAQGVLRAGLQLHLKPTRLDYARPPFDGYFRNEPVVFDLFLLSRFSDGGSGAEADWLDRLEGTLWTGDFHARTMPREVPIACDRRTELSVGAVKRADRIEIASGGHVQVRCRLDTQGLNLTPGAYTLGVGWRPDLKSTAFREVKGQRELPTFLDGFGWFEIRELTTNDDRLDMLNHRAKIALDAGDLVEALEVLDDVLRTQPKSVSALMTRARVQAARGDCNQARRDWQAAVLAVEQDLDGGNDKVHRLTPDQRRESVAYLRTQQRTLQCK